MGEGAWEPKSGVCNKIVNESMEREQTPDERTEEEQKIQEEEPVSPPLIIDPEDEFIVVDDQPPTAYIAQTRRQLKRTAAAQEVDDDQSPIISKKSRASSHEAPAAGQFDRLMVAPVENPPTEGINNKSSKAAPAHQLAAPFPPVDSAKDQDMSDTGGRRKRRGRPPGSSLARSLGIRNSAPSVVVDGEKVELTIATNRPRRSTRRETNFNDAAFSQDNEDSDHEKGDIPSNDVGGVITSLENATKQQHRHHRRKPLLSSPVPAYVEEYCAKTEIFVPASDEDEDIDIGSYPRKPPPPLPHVNNTSAIVVAQPRLDEITRHSVSINSISAAEQMFGKLLKAISTRFGRSDDYLPPPGEVGRSRQGWNMCYRGAHDIINLDDDLFLNAQQGGSIPPRGSALPLFR